MTMTSRAMTWYISNQGAKNRITRLIEFKEHEDEDNDEILMDATST